MDKFTLSFINSYIKDVQMVTIKDIQKIAFILTQLNNYGAGNKPLPRKFLKQKL